LDAKRFEGCYVTSRSGKMRIRSTERCHKFTNALFEYFPLYDLQGLTLDANYHFTAGVEAAEFEAGEKPDVLDMYSPEEWSAKICLCNQLRVPLYAMVFKAGTDFIDIFEMVGNTTVGIRAKPWAQPKLEDFPDWWIKIKGTEQSKPLYEAADRRSLYDQLIEKRGLAWGGNVDGFALDGDKIVAIIESRYTEKKPLERYDPAEYYTPKPWRAGDYNTWKPVVLLSSELKIPLFLFTFQRQSEEERVGISLIGSISKDELEYQNSAPYQNIVKGLANIKAEVMRNLRKPPPLER
jgi:hypothetical protein